jgi:hypothetical protein
MNEEYRLWEYLNEYATPIVALRAWMLWISLRGAPMPNACAIDDGGMIYTWDKDRHHFEIEFVLDGPTEYFYMDRVTGATWGAP